MGARERDFQKERVKLGGRRVSDRLGAGSQEPVTSEPESREPESRDPVGQLTMEPRDHAWSAVALKVGLQV